MLPDDSLFENLQGVCIRISIVVKSTSGRSGQPQGCYKLSASSEIPLKCLRNARLSASILHTFGRYQKYGVGYGAGKAPLGL
jgi:hypothetical protein